MAWFLPLFVPKLDGLMGKKSMLTAGRSQGEEGKEGSQRQRTLPLAKERRPTRVGLGSGVNQGPFGAPIRDFGCRR